MAQTDWLGRTVGGHWRCFRIHRVNRVNARSALSTKTASYADDGQLYINCPAADAVVAIRQLGACVADVDAWMKANRLRLNPQKTQLIWLGSRQQLEKLNMVDIELVSASLSPLSAVHKLGVTIDSRLTMADHVSAVCRACYFQLRQLRVILQSLTSEAATSLVHAFISCRLDYCNALTVNFSDCSLCRPTSRNEISRQ